MTASRIATAHALLRVRRRAHANAATGAPLGRTPSRVRLTYLICTTPRSGSWLLSESLASTSVAGNPREWFHAAQEQDHRARWRMTHASDLAYVDYLRHIRSRATTRNGICGIKVHYYQFAELREKLAHTPAAHRSRGVELSDFLPNIRYLWLTRRDKARQAISYYRAVQTNQWWLIDGEATGEGEEPSIAATPPIEPEFDPHHIRRLERLLVDHDERWAAYFKAHGIDPLVVHYEDLLEDRHRQIVRVLQWLGVREPEHVALPPPRLRRQATARTEDWLVRYTAFKTEAQHLPPDAPAEGETPPLPRRSRDVLRGPWRRWIGQQKLARIDSRTIVDTLTRNGCDATAAAAEVAKADADPYLRGATHVHARSVKGAALLNALGELRKLESHPTITRTTHLSSNDFRDHYYAANRPVLFDGRLASWRALSEWTPDYLRRELGDITVEVMTDRNADPDFEVNAAKHRTSMRFGDYIDKVQSGVVTNDYNLVANNGFFQRFPTHRLLEDLHPTLPFLRPAPPGEQCFFWFGPAGALTPLHHDTSNILVAQIVGRKRYRLVPSTQWECVYNSRGVFGDVDPESPDYARHPRFRAATVIDVILAPGEVLFVPVGWWHHVRAVDVSISVSFTNFAYPNHYHWEPTP
jgi:LPS sulfotransferase NodH